MELTLKEYINNPGGKGDSTNNQKELTKQLYTQKFDALLAREASLIKIRQFKNGDKYIIVFKIPDETVEKFYYDVVFEFYAKNTDIENEHTLNNYYVRFYSNDPAFMFTYAYVFNKNGLFIKDLESRMSKLALTQKPIQRNPNESIGYIKTMYFAYLYFKFKGYDKKVLWEKAENYSKSQLLDYIMHAEDKLNQRNELAKTQRAEKKFRSKKEKELAEIDNSSSVNKIKSVIKTKVVGKVNNVKGVKKVKRK